MKKRLRVKRKDKREKRTISITMTLYSDGDCNFGMLMGNWQKGVSMLITYPTNDIMDRSAFQNTALPVIDELFRRLKVKNHE